MNRLQKRIVDDYEAGSGRHDQPEIYAEPAGDPGLIGPGSVSWELHSDMATLGIGGAAAIVMEIMHPLVMAGVHDLSSYREKPFDRARNTLGYVLQTTYGNTEKAERIIKRVHTMHGRVRGTAPDGRPYEALDPELIGWVHTSIPWAVMRFFERYNRPLSVEEKNRYLAEQAPIGRAGGAGDIPETVAELDDYLEEMRPKLAITWQTREFFGFMLDSPFGPNLPTPVARRVNQLGAHAAMSAMPKWAREITGFDHSDFLQRTVVEPWLQANTKAIRWAFGKPAFLRLAEGRVAGATASGPGRARAPGARRTATA